MYEYGTIVRFRGAAFFLFLLFLFFFTYITAICMGKKSKCFFFILVNQEPCPSSVGLNEVSPKSASERVLMHENESMDVLPCSTQAVMTVGAFRPCVAYM